MEATQRGHKGVVKELVERNANPNLTNKVSWFVLIMWIVYCMPRWDCVLCHYMMSVDHWGDCSPFSC